MSLTSRTDWLTPAALLALSIIPIAAGTVRLVAPGAAELTSYNARFVAAPISIGFHIVSSAVFCVLGAFQFAPEFRRRNPNWHRMEGGILVPCGMVAALSGLWMTQFHPPADFIGAMPASFDGPALYLIRILAGSSMAVCLGLGVTAVLKRDFRSHRAWMTRGYALGLGAGTQVFTHIPWFIFPEIRGKLARTLSMG
jgi:uncharacterized membrane protein